MNIISALQRPLNGKYHKGPRNTNYKLHFAKKKEVSLNKMVNNKTIVTQDTGHQTSRAEAEC